MSSLTFFSSKCRFSFSSSINLFSFSSIRLFSFSSSITLFSFSICLSSLSFFSSINLLSFSSSLCLALSSLASTCLSLTNVFNSSPSYPNSLATPIHCWKSVTDILNLLTGQVRKINFQNKFLVFRKSSRCSTLTFLTTASCARNCTYAYFFLRQYPHSPYYFFLGLKSLVTLLLPSGVKIPSHLTTSFLTPLL